MRGSWLAPLESRNQNSESILVQYAGMRALGEHGALGAVCCLPEEAD